MSTILSEKFTSVSIITVYMYCVWCKLKQCTKELYDVISSKMTKQPDGIFIVAGDFDQANLTTKHSTKSLEFFVWEIISNTSSTAGIVSHL